MSNLDQERILAINRAGWNQVASRFYGGTALPTYGPLAAQEDTLGLLDPLPGKCVLELGCGSGHSLQYMAERGAAEVWGLDFSSTQIAYAADVLKAFGSRAHLFESPMEVDPGLPANYFDLVLSIYGIGWTTDLPRTLELVFKYLKPGGCAIFSGEHPVYSCLEYTDQKFVFARPYLMEESVEHDSWNGVGIVIHKRTLSGFINALAHAGLRIERLVEPELHATPKDQTDPSRWYTVPRAQLVPTTFIVKVRKPREP